MREANLADKSFTKIIIKSLSLQKDSLELALRMERIGTLINIKEIVFIYKLKLLLIDKTQWMPMIKSSRLGNLGTLEVLQLCKKTRAIVLIKD